MPLPTGRPHISDETPGPALAVLAICSAGASALVAGSAIAYQLNHRHMVRGSRLDLEWNILLTFALVVSIAQSAVTASQVNVGLGYPIGMLTQADRLSFEKLEYANNLLYVGALMLLKGVQFMLQIATTFQKPNYYVITAVMAGMLGFLMAAAFECQSPFWHVRQSTCVNQSALWFSFGVFDIVSDIYSVTTVMWVSKGLKLETQSKVKLLVIMGSKYLPVACAIARLPFIHAAYTSPNYTIALYKLGMPTQIQLHLSVMALSLGKVFRFLSSLDVGYLSSSIEPTHGKGTGNLTRTGKYSFGYNSVSKWSKKSANRSKHSKKGSVDEDNNFETSSRRNLVPGYHGKSTTEIEGGFAMEKMPSRTTDPSTSMEDAQDVQPNEIRVTRRVEVRQEYNTST